MIRTAKLAHTMHAGGWRNSPLPVPPLAPPLPGSFLLCCLAANYDSHASSAAGSGCCTWTGTSRATDCYLQGCSAGAAKWHRRGWWQRAATGPGAAGDSSSGGGRQPAGIPGCLLRRLPGKSALQRLLVLRNRGKARGGGRVCFLVMAPPLPPPHPTPPHPKIGRNRRLYCLTTQVYAVLLNLRPLPPLPRMSRFPPASACRVAAPALRIICRRPSRAASWCTSKRLSPAPAAPCCWYRHQALLEVRLPLASWARGRSLQALDQQRGRAGYAAENEGDRGASLGATAFYPCLGGCPLLLQARRCATRAHP